MVSKLLCALNHLLSFEQFFLYHPFLNHLNFSTFLSRALNGENCPNKTNKKFSNLYLLMPRPDKIMSFEKFHTGFGGPCFFWQLSSGFQPSEESNSGEELRKNGQKNRDKLPGKIKQSDISTCSRNNRRASNYSRLMDEECSLNIIIQCSCILWIKAGIFTHLQNFAKCQLPQPMITGNRLPPKFHICKPDCCIF